jgi:hypothetical protein
MPVAVAADIIQLPVVFISVLGVAANASLEALDLAIDVVVACIMNSLVGFHWALLPTSCWK